MMVSRSGIYVKRVVIDARNRMLRRLASILAKKLFNGQKVVVVNSEKICMFGGLVRQKMKYMRFLRKRMNTKPSHDPIHFRAFVEIHWRAIRGMIPHKTKHEAAALAHLKAYEVIPPIPTALITSWFVDEWVFEQAMSEQVMESIAEISMKDYEI